MDGNRMAKHEGRLELTWTDKDKTLLSVGDGRYGYTFVDPADYRASEVRVLHVSALRRFFATSQKARAAGWSASDYLDDEWWVI